jgi:hypothetical protein
MFGNFDHYYNLIFVNAASYCLLVRPPINNGIYVGLRFIAHPEHGLCIPTYLMTTLSEFPHPVKVN